MKTFTITVTPPTVLVVTLGHQPETYTVTANTRNEAHKLALATYNAKRGLK